MSQLSAEVVRVHGLSQVAGQQEFNFLCQLRLGSHYLDELWGRQALPPRIPLSHILPPARFVDTQSGEQGSFAGRRIVTGSDDGLALLVVGRAIFGQRDGNEE